MTLRNHAATLSMEFRGFRTDRRPEVVMAINGYDLSVSANPWAFKAFHGWNGHCLDMHWSD